MHAETVIEHLELLAEKLGVEVRFEHVDGPGGMCQLRGAKIIFVNDDLDLDDQVLVIGSALSSLDFDSVFVVPEVRELLEAFRSA